MEEQIPLFTSYDVGYRWCNKVTKLLNSSSFLIVTKCPASLAPGLNNDDKDVNDITPHTEALYLS